MVNLPGGCQSTLLLATDAQRIGLDKRSTDLAPDGTIALIRFWVAVVEFISLRFLFGMCNAKPTVCQFRTARIRARAFGFQGHNHHLVANKKPPRFPVKAFMIL